MASQYLIPGVGVVCDGADGSEWLVVGGGVLTGTATAGGAGPTVPLFTYHYKSLEEVEMQYLKQSTASQTVLLGPFVDDADGKTAETGLTLANTDIQLVKHAGTTAGNKNSGGGTHIASGYYYATLDATDTDTVGRLDVFVSKSGALPVRKTFWILEEAIYDALFAASAGGFNSSGRAVADVIAISGDTTAADNLELQFDGTGLTGDTFPATQAFIGNVTPGSTVTLASSFNNSQKHGLNWTLALGGQDIGGSAFVGAESVTGTGTCANGSEPYFENCAIGLASLTAEAVLLKCGIGNTLTLTSSSGGSNDLITFRECYQSGAPAIDASGTTKTNTIQVLDYTGNLTVTLSSYSVFRGQELDIGALTLTTNGASDVDIVGNIRNCTLTSSGTTPIKFGGIVGYITINGTGGTVTIRGIHGPVVDNSGGTITITDEGILVSDVEDINTIISAIQAKTDNLPASPAAVGSAMTLENDSITAAVVADGAIDAATFAADVDAEVATWIWNAATASYGSSGSYGEALEAVGSSADPWLTNLPGAYGAGTAGYAIGTNLDATVSSRATQTSVDTVDDFLDTEIAAIKAKTDNLPANPAAVGSEMTLEDDAITAAKIATDAISADGLANDAVLEIIDALLARDIGSGSNALTAQEERTVRSALRFLRNYWDVSGGTLTVRTENDTTVAWTATVTGSAGADPIVSNNPT